MYIHIYVHVYMYSFHTVDYNVLFEGQLAQKNRLRSICRPPRSPASELGSCDHASQLYWLISTGYEESPAQLVNERIICWAQLAGTTPTDYELIDLFGR